MARGAAIVIGGAVAKGAFAAGALAELTKKLHQERTPIRTLVGTSSGALNATMIAAGVRAGDPVGAASKLVELWQRDADFWHVFEPDLGGWWHRRGLSGTERIVGLLRRECPVRDPATPPEHVSLRIVVSPLAGVGAPRATFEHVERFIGADLDAKDRRECVFRAAVASAAFPIAFEPVTLQDVGPSVDGGIVNNTPIGEAIDQDPEVDVVYVISADPSDLSLPREAAAALGGSALVLRLVEILIDERLTRDLAEARAVNRWIGVLDRLALAPQVRSEVIRGLYPDRDPDAFRRVELVEIRPTVKLGGNGFKGFFKSDLRREYIERGRAAAMASLEGAPRPS